MTDRVKGIIENIHAKNLDQEVGETLKKILEILKEDKEATYNDFAILVRANDSAGPFIRALERAGLPYQFLASRGLYSKPVILDLISYFKLLDNYHEGAAVYRILNLPILEIPDIDVATITQYSHRKTKSLFDALLELPLISGVSAKTQEKVAFILSLIKKHSQMAREKSVSEMEAMALKSRRKVIGFVSKTPDYSQYTNEHARTQCSSIVNNQAGNLPIVWINEGPWDGYEMDYSVSKRC